MTAVFTVDDGLGELPRVTTDAELDAVLDKATTAAQLSGLPAAVYIIPGDDPHDLDAPFLGLGVGREFSYLTHKSAYVPGDLDGGVAPAWYYAEAHGELDPGMAIPVEDAREAAREFVRTGGQRPSNVEWVEEG